MRTNASSGKWSTFLALIFVGASSLQADYWESRARGPGARVAHTTVFTGTEVIVWGGGRANTWLNDGARYDIATDTWTAISANHNLEGHWWHVAVWTGTEMIVWGGWIDHAGNEERKGPPRISWKLFSEKFSRSWAAIRLHRP